MDVALVKNANRMMTTAVILDDGIELGFADGRKGLMPYSDVPEIRNREGVCGVELPNPFEMVLYTVKGESVDVPWDFARHYCDETYRPTVETVAAFGRQTVGARIRKFRESAGLTQEELARAADIGRVTLVRLEKGEQSPRFQTLRALANALGMESLDALVEPDSHPGS